MQTVVLGTDTPGQLSAAADRAIDLLKDGEIVALPTETVYGLAANALRPSAVSKVFEAKARPEFNPLICHLPDPDWLTLFTQIPPASRELVDRLILAFWPGPLTLVLPRRDTVPDIVAAGLPTVAVRMSIHPIFREVIERFAKPLAAPSANRYSHLSPTKAEHVVKELDGRIGLVLDGGPTVHGVESTIVAVEGDTLRLLRAGPIPREHLAGFATITEAVPGARPEAPGHAPHHYAPRTPLRLVPFADNVAGSLKGETGVLAFRGGPKSFRPKVLEVLSTSGDLREAAATLFAKLRHLDESGCDEIVAEEVPATGIGLAILDRLRRASASKA